MASLDEFAAMRAAVDVPILANMTEFGKSDLFTVQQLQDVGVNMVIFPVSLLRIAMGAIERGLDALAAEGSLASVVPSMQTRARLYELVDYAGYSGVRRRRLHLRPREQPHELRLRVTHSGDGTERSVCPTVSDRRSPSPPKPETPPPASTTHP